MLPGEVAALVPGVGAVLGVERIKHGLTNDSWLVRTAADALVVRISNTSEGSLQIHRASEALILQAMALAGIGPEVLLCDPSRHLLVTRYMGATWTEAEAVRSDNIVRIAALLRRLHALTPPPGLHTVDFKAVVEGYLVTLDEHDKRPTAGGAALWARASEVAQMLQQDSRPCLFHNDVHALNIVNAAEQGLRLIDWEYAGLGEPLFDLASLCMYHRYDNEQRAQLLAAYEPTSGRMSARRLELACWLLGYIRDLWMAVRETTR
jgi:thiamine kinase